MKLDSNGNILWAKTYDSGRGDDYFKRVKIGPDGYIYAVGITGYSGYYNPVIVKINSDGTIIWTKIHYNSSINEDLRSIEVDSNHIYISISDTNNYKAYLIISDINLTTNNTYYLNDCRNVDFKIDFITNKFYYVCEKYSANYLGRVDLSNLTQESELISSTSSNAPFSFIDYDSAGNIYLAGLYNNDYPVFAKIDNNNIIYVEEYTPGYTLPTPFIDYNNGILRSITGIQSPITLELADPINSVTCSDWTDVTSSVTYASSISTLLSQAAFIFTNDSGAWSDFSITEVSAAPNETYTESDCNWTTISCSPSKLEFNSPGSTLSFTCSALSPISSITLDDPITFKIVSDNCVGNIGDCKVSISFNPSSLIDYDSYAHVIGSNTVDIELSFIADNTTAPVACSTNSTNIDRSINNVFIIIGQVGKCEE